jgi:hypothetical protein
MYKVELSSLALFGVPVVCQMMNTKSLDHIKPHYSQPLDHLFLAWARKSGNLNAKLSGIADHDHGVCQTSCPPISRPCICGQSAQL